MRKSTRVTAAAAQNGNVKKNIVQTSSSKKNNANETSLNGDFDPYGVNNSVACNPENHANSKGKLGQKKPCLNNPICLYGLGEYRDGIWGNVEEMKMYKDSGLGENRWKERPQNVPAGLENLGATCYVNSLLQTLFHNDKLKALVYEWKGESVGTGSHALALQKLFVSLDIGTASTVDPTNFVKLLNLQTGVQQDAQEFNKLLLDHLSEVMTTKLTDMFRGELEYETKCKECGNCSSRKAHFFELELPIRGETSLLNCLQALQHVEHLTGDNQYMCDICKKKCDAERRIVLSELPEVLNLQLLRFVFDAQALAKRKLKDNVEIPSQLELTISKSDTPVIYDLTAVLYHRGAGAHSGHYVAEVLCGRDDREKEWWVFNDDLVEKKNIEDPTIKRKPSSSASSSSQQSKDAYMLVYRKRSGAIDFQTVSANQTTPDVVKQVIQENEDRKVKLDEYTRKRKLFDEIIEMRKRIYEQAFTPAQLVQNGHAKSSTKKSDRYWIPTDWLKCWINGERVVPKPSAKTTKEDPIELDRDDNSPKNGASSSSSKDIVIVDDDDYQNVSKTAHEAAASSVAVPTERRQFCQFKDDSFFKLFNDPIDFSPYICEHGKLIPSSAKSNMKLVPAQTWQTLLKSGVKSVQVFKEGDGMCRLCASSSSDSLAKAKLEFEECTKWEQILVQSNSTNKEDEIQTIPMVWISKNWVKEFRERNKEKMTTLNQILVTKSKNNKRQKLITMDAFVTSIHSTKPEGSSLDINADIICPHNGLVPGRNVKRLLSTEHWDDLIENVENGKWKNSSTKFAANECQDCTKCQVESIEAREEAKRERETRDGLLKGSQYGLALKELLKRRHGHPGASSSDFQVLEEFVIVPRSFVNQVREYLEGRIDNLPSNIDCSSFLCVHDKLKVSPRALQFIRGKGSVNMSLFPKEDSINTSDGDLMEIELLSAPEYDAMLHVVDFAAINKNQDVPMSAEEEKIENHQFSRISLRLNVETDTYECHPEFCLECMEQLTKQYETSRTVFTEKVVYVTRLAIGQIPPGGDAQTIKGSARASSARSTRQGNKRSPVYLSSSDTVYLVKMKIYQSSMGLKCEPSQIRLYHNGKLLESNELTLEMMGIRAGDDLYYDTNGSEDDDLVGLVQEAERGFSGTALQSSSSNKIKSRAASPRQKNKDDAIILE
jgi:ubiquitin C-terminal hydrolase